MSKCAHLLAVAALVSPPTAALAQAHPVPEAIVQEHNDAVAAASAAEATAAAKRAAVNRRAKALAEVEANLRTGSSAYLNELKGKLAKDQEAADKADEAALVARAEAQTLAGLIAEIKTSGTQNVASPMPSAIVAAAATAPSKQALAAVCSLDNGDQIRNFDPEECFEAKTGASQGATSLPDRVVDRKGVTADLSISGDSSKASIKFANAHNLRLVTQQANGDDFRQRRVTVGYNIGVQTTNVAASNGRIYGLAEDAESRSLRELDRLDEKASVTAGISLNGFPSVGGPALEKSVAAFVENARAACKASAPQQICTGTELTAWIKSHPTYRKALEDILWGTGQKVAKWGLGLQGELARPAFEFFPFETISISDPLNPSKTKSVIDLTRIPAGFPEKPSRQTKLPFALSGYGFWHFPVAGRFRNRGITTILSGTWKRSYAIAKDRTGVIICPSPNGVVIETNENCRTVNVAAPAAKNESFVAGEIRTLFDGWWVFPGFGLAPKLTYQIDGSRRSFDVPLYVSANQEGTLNGGLRLKWDSGGKKTDGTDRKDELLFSIFFNTNFDLTPR